MESVKILEDDVIQRLKNISDGYGLNPNDFLNKMLDDYDQDTKIFEERTRKALERVESKEK